MESPEYEEAKKKLYERLTVMNGLCWLNLTDEEILNLTWEQKIERFKELGIDTTDLED